ncbi:microtubule-associated tumor suppressor 1 homolog [Dendronephthya gigantea]|uniref:microtubule-associated tumor suppressor 1 homolog n=1 Tax=Dendronephthya gigantea TaxID=151771 RepID=UPI001068DF36|nr:microtubule-associated tumor suppressor 1 homolog [Dendronephthya gigantea]
MPNLSHLRSDLSPKFEVKQSIKLDSINSARFPAPANLDKDKDTNLNKTFLVRAKSPGAGNECGQLCETSGSDLNEKTVKSDDLQTKPTPSCTDLQNLNASSASMNESDGENTRPRTGSKSSWSSVESLSSVGSVKSNRERSRLNGTKTPRKLPCPTECSKSKLVKISGNKKEKPKIIGRETETTTHEKQTSKSTNKPGVNNVIDKKGRTKSTSVVAPRSVLASATATKSTMRSKSKSVSTDVRDVQLLGKSKLNPSKFATPLSSKISAAPAKRLTSTPITKRTVGLEKKSRLNGTSKRSRLSPLSGSNCVDKQSDVGSTVSSLPSRKNYQKESETKQNVSKSRNLSTSSASNKSLSAKARTLSVSAVSKLAGHESISTKNLSTPSTIKEEIKPRTSKLRNVSTSKAEHQNGLRRPLSVSSVSENISTNSKSIPQPRKIKPGEQLSVKERQNSDESVKKRPVKEKIESTSTGLKSCLSSAATPDILKQTPEVTRHSIAIQVDTLQHDEEEKLQKTREEKRKEDLLLSSLVKRNREFESCLVALQVYAQKVDVERESISVLRKNLKFTKERYHSTENMLVKESNQRARLEEEMLSAKSDSVVEVALLRAAYERKQEIIQAKLKESHKKDLEKVRKQHMKSMEDVKHSCDLKLKRIEETYVEDIAQINETHKDVIAELESQHSKHVDDLVEERHAEIEIIKADYDEQFERIQESLSQSEKACNELEEKLRVTEDEAKRDIELRIQDAIAKYKSLPDELESMKFVLEMKNSEVKNLRRCNAELQHKIDELQQIKERAALLEREKESLNFVVENKVYFERQLSLERDKLRLSLDREVATSKRLSLEKEELAWRLNSYQNSPTSPTTGTDRFNWRLSGFNSPDSAVYSQRIEESDFEYQINDTKEIEN